MQSVSKQVRLNVCLNAVLISNSEQMQESNEVEGYINCTWQILIEGYFRGKYITLDLTAWGKWGCCCFSMSPSPTNSKDEDVFPVGTHTEHTYTKYIHSWLQRSQTLRALKRTGSTSGPILFPFLAGQDGSLLVRVDTPIYIYIYMHTQMHTWQRAHTQERVRKEFNKKIGQTVLIRHGAQPDKLFSQQIIYMWLALLSPYLSIFPLLFFHKSPNPLPCPPFGSSPKHCIISPMLSQTAFCPYPIMQQSPC